MVPRSSARRHRRSLGDRHRSCASVRPSCLRLLVDRVPRLEQTPTEISVPFDADTHRARKPEMLNDRLLRYDVAICADQERIRGGRVDAKCGAMFEIAIRLLALRKLPQSQCGRTPDALPGSLHVPREPLLPRDEGLAPKKLTKIVE